MNKFDVIVLGAGASGTLCAVLLAKSGLSVCVIDANDFPAKKLLVTGNGRCNLTNKNISNCFYNRPIDKYFDKFDNFDTIKLFKSFGLETYFDEEGRCYPISNSAKSVCFVLKKQFEKQNIFFAGDQTVCRVFDDEKNFFVKTSEGEYSSQKIVFATGHCQQMLDIAKPYVKNCAEFVPSLVALKTKENTKKLSGERLSDVKVWANCGDQIFEQNGEVLFKDNGLSGICIFNISAIFAKNNFDGLLKIDLLPNVDKIQLVKMIEEKIEIFDVAEEFLQGIFSKQLSFEILKRAGISLQTDLKNLTKFKIETIANIIKQMTFTVCGHYENNQVCLGGVKLDALTSNLQSKINGSVYFCGEICDVCGMCGGYNLQWAFTSAKIVAENIINGQK